MKKETSKVSRRNFLAAGSAAVTSSVLLAGKDVEAKSNSEEIVNEAVTQSPVIDEPVTTTAVQTLTNKTISAENNTLIIGTEYLNIRQMQGFPTGTDTDITVALNNAIAKLKEFGTHGGQILIPRGLWTSSGGHNIGNSTSIEGVGVSWSSGFGEHSATEIKMIGNGSYMFRIGGDVDGLYCSLKNMTIRMNNNPTATGLLMTAPSTHRIYGTYLENVHFWGGAYGIKVATAAGLDPNYKGDWSASVGYQAGDVVNYGTLYYKALRYAINKIPPNYPTFWAHIGTMGEFECILNVFNRVTFGCEVGLYCDTNNSGFEVNTPYIYLPASANAVAFYCYIMGSLTVNNHLCVSSPGGTTIGTSLLYTVGAYNTITFQNGGQDEGIQYLYRNAANHYSFSPIVFRNCLIQSEVKITANSSFVSDNNMMVNFIGSPTFKDSANAWCKLYLMGKNGVQTRNANQEILYGQETLHAFSNPNSAVINPFNAPLGY